MIKVKITGNNNSANNEYYIIKKILAEIDSGNYLDFINNYDQFIYDDFIFNEDYISESKYYYNLYWQAKLYSRINNNIFLNTSNWIPRQSYFSKKTPKVNLKV